MNMRYSFTFILALLILFSFQGLWAQSYTNSNVGKLISNTVPSTNDTITVSTSIPIADINIRVDTLIHTYDADVDMYIITPAGDTLELSTDNGSLNDNYILTVFDQEAAISITAGTAPFTGSFIPEQDISPLYGTDAIGDWVIFIVDDAGGDDGTLQQWGLDFTAQSGDDAGVASIDSPATPYCSGTGLWVTIANYGVNTLTSATVNWTLNGAAQTPYAWTGSIPSGGTDGPVMIASTAFVDDDSIVAWTSMPNGTADGNPANDTSSTVVKTGIASGTYTIGGVIGYPTFTAAVNDLNARGICGPVEFDVQLAASPYVEQIELGEIVGASSTNTITFNGNGSTLRWGSTDSDNRHVVRLNGADYVTFNDLTIEVDPDSTYGWGVHLTNGADHNTFNNVTVKGDTVSSSSTNFNGIVASGSNTSATTAGNNANYLTIDSCTVMGGYYTIRLNGNSGGLDAVGNTIMNSTIQDAYAYHIYLDDNDGALVSGNDISRANRSTGTSFYGVFLTSGNLNCTIEKNYIHNTHDSQSSLTGAAYLIYFSGCDAPVGQENVAKNNVIYNINGDGIIYAIYNSGSDGAHYYNNSISLDYPSTAGTTRGFYQTTTADNVDFRNNVLTVTRGGSGVKHGLYFSTTTSTIISDNNAIYVASDVNFGRFGTTEYPTYTDWRTANGGAYDSLSVNADPLYADLANGDLTPSNGLINDIGVSLPEVTEDILGNPRGVPPDPGAYEFSPSATDVAVSQFLNFPSSALPNATVNFGIEVSNIGSSSVPAGSLDVYLNGALNSSYGYTALASTESDTVSASFTASASGTDVVTAALQMVPGDGNLLNDTLETSLPIETIYTAPYFEHFDSTTAGTPGTLPPGWTNATDDDHDWWVETSGTQNSSSTGPLNDHSGTGNYMYVESSTPYFPNLVANLLSPYFDLSGMTKPGVEFWFHMYGAAMGEMHFDVWSSGTGWVNDIRSPLVGQYQTAETDPWLRGGLDLTAFAGDIVQVRFRGITGSNFTSDMAVDDFRMNELDSLNFPYDIQARKVTMPVLSKIPLTQPGMTSAVDFGGSFTNAGPTDTGDLNVAVVNSGTVFSNSITGVTLPAFTDSAVSFGQWDASAAAADQYAVHVYSSNFTSPNDTASAPLELGETIAWDYGNHTNSIAYSSTLENFIGTRFTLTDADTLTSVSMLITSSVVLTDSFSIDLYTSVNDTPGVAIARIFRGSYNDVAPLPALVTFFISGGMAMPVGDFYAILNNDLPTSGSFPIGADNTALGSANIPRRFAFRSSTSDWLYFEDAGNAVFQTFVPIIRAGFQETGEVHDFAVDSLAAEQACMTYGETYDVSARVRNVGNQPETSVTIVLRENGLFAGDAIVSLNPGESTTVSFPYAPSASGLVKLDVVSLLLNDGNSANDVDSAFVRVTQPGQEVIFVDDFEDTTLTFASWYVTNDDTTNPLNITWMIYGVPYPNSYTLPATSSGNVAAADADESGGSGGSALTTAYLPLDLSAYDSVALDFDSDWNVINTSDTARVNVSTDGGTSWVTVLEWAGSDVRETHAALDLTSYLGGNADAVIAFQSIQPGWDWWWAIDNVCVSGVAGAQSQVIYEEIFPDTTVPAGWLVVDNDGSGTAWDFRQQVIFTSGDTVNPEAGQSFWFSNFTNANPSGLIDEWLISPQIYANSLDELTFYAGAIGGSFPDSLKVWVSTTGNDLNSFTNLIGYFEVDGPIGSWHPYNFDISQFSGNDIYVAINYYIRDGGPTGNNSDNVWVDHLTVTGQPGAPPGAKLLLTEIVLTPTGAEFVEIYNPGSDPVDLSNTYLTDATNAPTGEYYYNIVTGMNYGGGSGFDFHARFPDGAMIPAGAYQTIALNGDADFNAAYSMDPTYEIDQAEFASGTPDGIPDMREALPGSIYGPDSTQNPTLTNGDEVVILYYWDGFTDLVQDVDYLLYNSGSPAPNNEATSKTGVVIDGPDPDTIGTAYLADTDSALQQSAANAGSGFSVQRIDLSEGAQTMTGGNGINGADETSEDLNNTFTNAQAPTPNGPVTGIEVLSTIPTTFDISQNYPNPFNPNTTIKYQLPQLSQVTITIYNLLGQKVKSLVNDQKKPGYYEVEWNGLNDHGVQVATGLYIYRIQAADFVRSKKMILLK